jgi:hypothetical protein
MGKGGGGGGQTSSTVTNTNIPEYARGYVENMLGATQHQLFNTTTNPTTGETELGPLRSYRAYGGTYDPNGNMTSYDPSAAVAGFTPMQQMAQNGIYNLQMPGQFNAASQYTADAMQRAANAGYNPGQFTMGQAYAPDVTYYQMNQPTNIIGQQAGGYNLGSAPTAFAEQGRAQTGTAQTGTAAQFGDNPYTVGTAEKMAAARLGSSPEAQAAYMEAARLGSSPEAQAAYMEAARLGASPEMAAAQAQRVQLAQAAQMQAEQAGITQLGEVPTYTGQQLKYTPQNVGFERAAAERVSALPLERLQMQAARDVGTGSFTQPGAAQAYMSPYMQNVVDIQQREVQRQADIAGTKRGAQFAQAGAFGGSRQAIENAEAARNLATQKGDIQAQGLQSAFQAAQGQFNTEQQARLQAELANQQVQQQTGVQNLSALLQTQGLGAQTGLTAQQLNQQTGLQALLANQAAGIDTSKFNQQQQYNTALQNAQMLQQQQLANQSMQGQYGLQQGQMNQAVALQNAAQRQAANAANQGALNQFGLQQGQMDQATALQNAQLQQQAAANNQQYAAQYGIQNAQLQQAANAANQQSANQIALANQQYGAQYGIQNAQLQQAANAANQQSSNQIGLANQQMAGQYGLAQGQMNQAANAANQAAQNQINLADQALLGQFGLTQGQFNQQMAMGNVANQQQMAMANLANQQQNMMANTANRQQVGLANQALQGQYGLQQGTMSQANNQFNAQQLQAANLANQQMGYNTNLQNLQANLGVQQLGAGQNMQAQLANQQAMLANQQAIEQSRQFGANYGQQMNAQQLAAAQQLAGIGGQQLSAQQGIYGLQNQIGGQQQQLQQQIINQSMQDYANAQQYPLMQLGTMSNMLRGLPMQASTTNMYQAAPNAITQGIGAVGAYGALNGAFGGTTGRKEGGVINATKGGIMSYDVGGEIESTLSKMDVDDLKKYAKESNSPSIKQMAARLIQEKSMPVPRMARGGILAFAKGDKVDELAAANEEGLVSPNALTAMDVDYKAPTINELYANQKPFMDRSGYDAMVARTKDYVYPERPGAPAPSASFQTLSAPKPREYSEAFSREDSSNPQDIRLGRAVPPPARPAPAPAALTNPSALAAAPTGAPAPGAITQAAPVARPPAPAAAPAGIKMPAVPGYVNAVAPPEDPMVAKLKQELDVPAKTQREIYEQQQRDKAAIGLGPNQDLIDYRSKIMAERANLDDDAKRQKNLRLAEFFATWGSTPGATLVAGMTAFRKTVPTLIEDEKERKKVLRETDKLIYDLGQTERLEKKGNWDAAGEEKNKLAERGMKINEITLRYAGQRDQNLTQVATSNAQGKSHLDAATYTAQMNLRAHEATAAAHREVAAAQRESTNFARIQGALSTAYNAVEITQKNVENIRNGKDYQNSKLKLDQAQLMLQNDPNNQSKIKAVEEARSELNRFETDALSRVKQAQEMYDTAKAMYTKSTGMPVGGTDKSSDKDPLGILK